MAGRGPAPQLKHSRDSHTKVVLESMTRLTDDGVVRGHDLPDDREWPEATLELWETLRRTPMAATWLEVDWACLQDTMLLHSKFWEGDSRLAGEIRLRLAQFGASPEARLRLRLLIDGQDNQSTSPALDELMRRNELMRRRNERTTNPKPAMTMKGTQTR